MIRSQHFPAAILSVFLLNPLSCSSDQSAGPSIISFGANVAELTDGESVRFVAVVTDPAGTDQLVGGQLANGDGTIKYGAFVGSQPGVYALELSWAQISQSKPFAFGAEEKRTFIGEFYNFAGKKVAMPLELRFHCKGEPACEGRCTTAGSACTTSTDKLCVAGLCQTGCFANKTFVVDNTMSATNTCQVCQVAVSKTALQSLPNYAACTTGFTCNAGKCEVPFTAQNSKTTSVLYSVVTPSAMLQVAVGAFGTILRSTDGGATWNSVSSGVNNTLSGVFAVSASELYASGSSGTILKSTDGGASWSSLGSGVTNYLNGVWASGTNDVWVVGDSGTVLRSINGGTSWTKPSTGKTAAFNGVWGSSANDVYLVGDSGLALRTLNSGVAFTTLTPGVTTSLVAVGGTGAADVYMLGGSAGTVLRSTDSGTTWTKLTPPTTNYSMTGVWGSAANNIYIVGLGGQVWHTTDSATLTVVPSATSGSLFGISGSAASAFTVVGSAGAILRKL